MLMERQTVFWGLFGKDTFYKNTLKLMLCLDLCMVLYWSLQYILFFFGHNAFWYGKDNMNPLLTDMEIRSISKAYLVVMSPEAVFLYWKIEAGLNWWKP